ncbi:VOC family protein [Alkalihalophilus marmarensis]|uniref:Glyoxalase n=1 Tax=Alkalihalophilus marmarensis DSM 21297 TaxID=1188261 RepID=U6SJS8_9BACI|nr:VOC family protein [Alkalihalophilus marmarensis]ERN51647.1 glyoxalase [Alkalihalophilus marmarensis DSM 21297]MCM3490733.1 VOC family protein [Alkalihalophilus marmarensis]
MLKIVDLHHVSLVVKDLNQSIQFYKEILKLEEIERPGFDFRGAWFQIGGGQLHLIEDRNKIEEKKIIDSRGHHFAIRVEDYDQALSWLKKKGIEVIEKPLSKSGFAQIFCLDPDGHIIELHVERKA